MHQVPPLIRCVYLCWVRRTDVRAMILRVGLQRRRRGQRWREGLAMMATHILLPRTLSDQFSCHNISLSVYLSTNGGNNRALWQYDSARRDADRYTDSWIRGSLLRAVGDLLAIL